MMVANEPQSETNLAERAVAWLADRVPSAWSVELSREDGLDPKAPLDSRVFLKGPHGTNSAIAIEERKSITPRAVLLLSQQLQTARNMGAHMPLVVVAPWLSKRTQQLLAEQGLGYIDLTGNALVQIDNPPFYLQTTGSDRNPAPKDRGQAQLRGPKAARLIRLLMDARPPYGVGTLAEATGLAPGYVSRLLDTLDREALVERGARGVVESVDLAGLAHRWASSYDVFTSNQALGLIAPSGPKAFMEEVTKANPSEAQLAITGSFAAAAMKAPVAAPALLLAYCENPHQLAGEHGLLRSEEGANVVLLSPFDPVVWKRTEFHNHLTYVAPSQVVVDCLTGNGRMPAEGEALLKWMIDHEPSWRGEDLDALSVD